MHEACDELGIAVISGHTARYQGCDYPMVGGATVFAVGDADRYVTSGTARAGDVLICTKGAAIEATAVFAATFPEALRARIGDELADRAAALFYEMSVVKDAMTAVEYGVRDEGVTSLHDATEGGVVGGIFEIAQASGLGVRLDEAAIGEMVPVERGLRRVTAAGERPLEHPQVDPFWAAFGRAMEEGL